MNIHQSIEEMTDLAKTYAEDGAFHAAARVLKDLAVTVDQHARHCDSLLADHLESINQLGCEPKEVGQQPITLVLDHNRSLRVRHLKRGTEYEVLGQGSLQSGTAIAEGAHLVVYRDAQGLLWVRPSSEFLDGRFERVAS